MSKGVAKIKAIVARVGEVFAAILALLKNLKKGVSREAVSERRRKRDPVQFQIKVLLWLLLLAVWGGMAKLTQDVFAPPHADISHDKKSLLEKLESKALYPWTKGYTRGHDIVEPEVQADRGLAAAIDSRDLKVTVGARYVEFKDIEAVVKTGMGNHSRVLLSITLEVESYPAEQEVLAKEMKIREVVASILSTKDKGILQNFLGVKDFKNELLKRLTLIIRTGQVTDVLITT